MAFDAIADIAGGDAMSLALAAVEVATAAGVAAGLDPGLARDAAEEAVSDETGINRKDLKAGAAAAASE